MSDHPFYTGVSSKLTAVPIERVYSDQLPDGADMPSVRLAILNDTPHQRLASSDNITLDMQIDVYADRADSTNAWPVDQSIRSALDRQSITVEGFSSVQCICTKRGKPFKEKPYYRITSEYRFFGTAK